MVLSLKSSKQGGALRLREDSCVSWSGRDVGLLAGMEMDLWAPP